MKNFFILALLVATAFAVEENSQEISIEDAAFQIGNMMNMYRTGYAAGNPSMMMNQMMIPKPPQKAIDHYNSLRDDDFPVDYSMSCSNSCGCRQTCVMMWWMPCSCMCPPPCPTTTTTTEVPINRLPVFPPWSRPGPEPIPPQWPWQEIPPPPPNPQFPSFPNINLPIQTTQAPPLTHPPQPTRPAPPSWNNNWNNNNNNNNNLPLTHGPPNWTAQPIWPQPQPEPEPQWPWQNQPQVPLPLPEPLPPQNNWNNNWNNNQNNWNNNQNNQFPPHWPQPQPQWPEPEPIPPPRNDCNACNNQCSCTPCSVIWVCPPPCPSNCCNGNCARHFGEDGPINYENEKESEVFEEQNSNKIAFHHIPEYLRDIFIPGMI